jgi:mono/diheme cytochrome c family protein
MAVFAALALVAHSTSGLAADARRGELFARRVCAFCHVVAEGQPARDPDAPSFRSIAESRQFREKGVRLLWERHPKMPNLALTQAETGDLAAYLKSLAK